MMGSLTFDSEQFSGEPSTNMNYPVDDPQQLQQQEYIPSDRRMDPSLQQPQPALGFPVSDPSVQQQQQQNTPPEYNVNASLQQPQPASGYPATDPPVQQNQYTISTEHNVLLSFQQLQPAPGYPACQPSMQQTHPYKNSNGYNVDPSTQQAQPPVGYPAPEQPPSQGPYQQQPSHARSNGPTWQHRRAAPPAAPPTTYPPPPPPPQGYPGHPHQAPHSYSQYNQQQYPPPQYGNCSPYNNPIPTKPPPEHCYPAPAPPQQQPAHPPPGAPVFVSPMRPPQGQAPMTPLTPYNPLMIRPELGPPGPWSSEIFDFLQDSNGCLLTVLSPCVTFGQMAEILDTGYSSCAVAGVIYAFAWSLGIPCLYSYTYRTKMRRHFNLRADPVDDLIVHLFCELCAISQEYRELVYRGIDPALGYVMQQDIIARAIENPLRALMAVPPAMSMTH